MFAEQEIKTPEKRIAVDLFNEAYDAQMGKDYDLAIDLYKKSIDACPTAEAYTFLAWAYSFKGEYDRAIAECIAAISIDETFGNPYNDIGSYLIAQGNYYDSVRWFRLAIEAPRYASREFPYFNLARVFENRGKLLESADLYARSLDEQPNYKAAYVGLRRVQGILN